MRLYHLRTNIAEDLLQGYYTRNELGLSELTLLSLIENGNVEVVNEPIKCLLITNNGFKRAITLPCFRDAIEIPVYDSVEVVATEPWDNVAINAPDTDKYTFIFDRKIRGKNKFIYRQL